MGAPKEDTGTVRAGETFQRSEGSSVDEIAREVFTLMQDVPDGCEEPQAVVLELAREVEARREKRLTDRGQTGTEDAVSGSGTTTSPSSAERAQFLRSAVSKLDPKEREILLLHLSEGSHYRAIAERLNMQPSHVLGILRRAYTGLRWHTETVNSAAKPAVTDA